ncbi:hypothetical protein HJG60_008622 [Phyllostomus discolor]|uniref:non-specific serine/threonine protein kinase n=1 Tax=Phyllostomus discolor TaxID=89673 RepID=A0A834DKG4_9CHIR|nr:hypothetical protein HJG60_008622 [Phyllostomus discolor]
MSKGLAAISADKESHASHCVLLNTVCPGTCAKLPGGQRLHDGEGGLNPVQAAGTSGTASPAEGHCLQEPDTGGHIVTELNIKLADFGLSSECIGHKLITFCGTLSNTALEFFLHHICDDLGVNVWSLGVVVYQMAVETLLFVGEDFWKLKQQILSMHFHEPYFMSINSQKLKKEKLMTLNPSKRRTLEDVMKGPWLNMDQQRNSGLPASCLVQIWTSR